MLTLGVTLAGRLAWRAWPFELVTNFPVQLFVAAALITLLAVATRAKVTLGIAVLALLINFIIVAPNLMNSPRDSRAGAATLTIGHLNAQTNPIDVPGLTEYLARTRPDVFVVLEPIQADVGRISRSAVGFDVLPISIDDNPDIRYIRTLILSRAPIDGVRHPTDRSFSNSTVELTVRPARAPIELLVLGTDSPTSPSRTRARDRALSAAARWSAGRGPRRLVIGDLNVTPWSPAFRRLTRDGQLHNSLDGFGLQVTWPSSNPLLRIPIDHALLGPALAATDRRTGPAFGSEHRGLLVTITDAA